jgi:hypothetical protein
MLLWGATTQEDDDRTLSWFAAPRPGEEAGIGDGTAEMVAGMLRDLGYQISSVTSFQVRHLRTDYVQAGTWGHAWEITAKLSAQVAELPLQGTTVESSATDATWSGVLPALPSECVLFVDFPRADVAERAERILGGAVGRELDVSLSHRGFETAQLIASFGVVDVDFFESGAPKAAKARAVFHELGARTSLP